MWRSIRKRIYDLERSDSPIARAALSAILATYGVVDRWFLRRAQRADLVSEKIVSHERSFVCVVVPKSASRTLIDGFLAAGAGNFDVNVVERPARAFAEGFDEYFRFAIVRDPWSRAYSCYKQKFVQSAPVSRARTLGRRPGLTPDMSFEAFVHWLGTPAGSDAVADRHWLSQVHVLGLDEAVRYDFIGRLDRFGDAIDVIAERLDIDASAFGHRLRSTSPREHLEAYTPDLVDAITRRYARDVEAFGFEPPVLASDPRTSKSGSPST